MNRCKLKRRTNAQNAGNGTGYLGVILISKSSQSLQLSSLCYELSSFWKFWQVRNLRLLFHLSVCLSVCLLAILRENGWTDFHDFFRVGGTWYREQLGTFSECSISPLEHKNFSPLFRRNPWLLAALQKNGWMDFHDIFRKGRTWHKEQSGTLFEMLRFTPLKPGSIYLFPGSVFVCNIMEKRVNGFSWNVNETSGTTQEIIS